MFRARDWYDRSDGLTRVILLAVLIILGVATLPNLINRVPLIANGVSCSALSIAPGNGTNQSVMKPPEGALRIELFGQENYTISNGLSFEIRFTNDSASPMILLFLVDEIVFRYSGVENGLSIWVQSTTTGQVLGEPANIRPAIPIRQQYAPEMLRWLGPRQRCTQTITISPQRAQSAGIVAGGSYQVAAVYRNTQVGNLSPVLALTPTPVFPNQGVFLTGVSGIRSNRMIFTAN
jgi:hypothetical protein